MRNIEQILQYEIRKKPALQAIYNRLEEMSIDELEKEKFPLPWIKKAFIDMKKKNSGAEMAVQAYARILDKLVIVESEGATGELIQWRGIGETFLQIDRDNLLDIKEGRYLFMPDTGGVYHDNVFSQYVDPKIYASGHPSGKSTYSEYLGLCQDLRNAACPIDAPVLNANQGSSMSATDRLSGLGVRFS